MLEKGHEGEHSILRPRVEEAICNLLAVIHRDGGQYTAKQGIEKSCTDAEKKVIEWFRALEI